VKREAGRCSGCTQGSHERACRLITMEHMIQCNGLASGRMGASNMHNPDSKSWSGLHRTVQNRLHPGLCRTCMAAVMQVSTFQCE
jgi:hypothetical protein